MTTVTEKISARIPLEAVIGRPKPPPVRRRRWVWWGAAALLGVGIFLWFLPTLVAHSFLLNWLVGYLAAEFQGKIHVGSASLGWFSPVVLRQIEIQDAQGGPLASIGQLTTEGTLWKLLWNRQELGRWVFDGAQVHIRLRPDGSNWEDALAGYLSPAEPASNGVQLKVEAKNAIIFFTDSRSGRSWRLENWEGCLVIPMVSSQAWQLVCTAQVLPSYAEPANSSSTAGQATGGVLPSSKADGARKPAELLGAEPVPAPTGPVVPGQLELELVWGGSAPQSPANADPNLGANGGYFVLRGQAVPLGLAEAILMRWEPMLHLEGRGSGWFVYGWGSWAEYVAEGRATPPTRSAKLTKAQDAHSQLTSATGSTDVPDPTSKAQTTNPGSPEVSSLSANTIPIPTDGRRPPMDLPPDTVVMQAEIVSEAAWVHWERFVPDRLQLKQMKLQGGIIWTNEYLQWEAFQLECQAGQLSLSGRTPLSSQLNVWLHSLRQHGCQASGRFDLAQLARLLPRTLPLQAGLEVTRGQADFDFAAQPGPEGAVWQAQLASSQLKALHQGRAIEWPEPIHLRLAAQQNEQGLVLETLQCNSEFLQIDAFSAEAGMSISAQMDLNRLSQRLSAWVNLGQSQLGGRAAFSLTCTKDAQDSFQADLMFQGDRLHVRIPAWSLEIADDIRARALIAGKMSRTAGSDQRPGTGEKPSSAADQTGLISLPRGTAALSNTKLTQYSLSSIDSAVLAFQWGQDRGEIRLRQPVSTSKMSIRWPLEIRLEGQLSEWVRRLKPWVDLQSYEPNGAYGLAASLDVAAEGVQVQELRLVAAPLSVKAFGLQISEPRIDLTLTGLWDWTNRRIQMPQARFQANPLRVEAEDVQIQWAGSATSGTASNQDAGDNPPSAIRLVGRLHAEGTLDHLQRWFVPVGPNSWRLGGSFTAQAEFQSQADATTGQGQITIRQFSYTASSTSRPWQQPELRLAAQGRYDHHSGLLELTACNLHTEGLGYEGTAQISPATPSSRTNQAAIYRTSGQLHYDWPKLTPMLRRYLGSGIVLQGRGAEPLRWQGPLDLALAEASLGIGWQQLEAYGFRAGPATLRGQLSRGMLQIAPIEMALSEGKLLAAGAVRLAPEPMELVLEKGTAARQIRISPQMCASAFQYIAPVLAEVTTVEGRVSLVLDVCRVPLANPAASQLQGQLVIHNIHIGPGPLVQELATLLMKEPTARLRNEAVIPFTMANGRIYHEGLELVFPEITIRTQGYVGLDQSLALVAEMPILPKWTAMNPRLATAMKDQVIRLPIRGTLRRPQLDQATLRRYAAQFLQKSAENLLQEELQRQLERLKLPGR
ncbi:MAG: hypothetical protein NZ602_12365 [Thermoguttaceae bacterium]|nr:hypothetical protein [Thermoguttaceae bacterium]